MATSTTVMAQFIRYSANGDQTIVNLKSVADAISLTKTDGSKYTAATMQELADSLGNLAFQDGISNASSSTAGLMSASDKSKLDGIAAGANKYTHPAYTARSAGLYKITVDATGHVSAVTTVAKADITGLGIPGQDTTYSVATTSANGLMSSSDKSKLDGIAANANNYSLPTAGSGLGGVKTTSSVSNASGYTACPIIGGVVYYKDTNTTYSAVTQSANGLMLASDKKKLDGIATNANNYVHPTSSGNKHIPAGGSAGQILGYSSDGTAAWQDPFYIGSDTPSTACMWLKTE